MKNFWVALLCIFPTLGLAQQDTVFVNEKYQELLTVRNEIISILHQENSNLLKAYLTELQQEKGSMFVEKVLNFSQNYSEDPESEHNLINTLHYASYPLGYAPNIEVLLQFGADPYLKDMYGNYPMHRTLWTQKLESMKVFLAHGIDPTLTDGYGWNILHWASRLKSCDIVIYLLDHMPNQHYINIADEEGNTALHHAMLFNIPTWWAMDNTCVIKELRKHGAVQMKNFGNKEENEEPKYPFELAAERGDFVHVEALYNQ